MSLASIDFKIVANELAIREKQWNVGYISAFTTVSTIASFLDGNLSGIDCFDLEIIIKRKLWSQNPERVSDYRYKEVIMIIDALIECGILIKQKDRPIFNVDRLAINKL